MRRIVSRDNPHYKVLKKLLQSGRERRRTGLAVLDGMHLIDAYSRHCGIPVEIFVSDSGTGRPEIASYLESGQVGATITVLGDTLFAELAVVETPSGIMAVVDRPGFRLEALAKPAAGWLASRRLPEATAKRLPGAKAPAWTMLTTRLSPLSSTALRRAKRPDAP